MAAQENIGKQTIEVNQWLAEELNKHALVHDWSPKAIVAALAVELSARGLLMGKDAFLRMCEFAFDKASEPVRPGN